MIGRDIERFLARIPIGDGCWEWTGSRDDKGYGTFSLASKNRKAHRLAFELIVGPVPEGLVLDHLCRNRLCVRPTHLDPVTQKVNVQRGVNVQRLRTHCPEGHPYEGNNLYRRPNGRRVCRTCHNAAQRRYEQRRREFSAP